MLGYAGRCAVDTGGGGQLRAFRGAVLVWDGTSNGDAGGVVECATVGTKVVRDGGSHSTLLLRQPL
jgi:hypothetical protein